MSNITGSGRLSIAERIQMHEGFIKTQETQGPGKGSGMSETATKRMGELQGQAPLTMGKPEKRELAGLQRQYDRPDMMETAKEVQKSGGVLAGHAVALTTIADERDVCICIRAVNPLATGLVESGFGTKDMSIKAKSSNLPPLNGLIPFDQSYGKKGNDPVDVEKFTHKNEEAVEKGVATTSDARMPFSRLDYLSKETGSLRIHEDVRGLGDNEILLTGNDFKSKDNPKGTDFHFIAVRSGDEVTIYAAKQEDGGVWKRDEKPIQVMANREGKPVTADYDLALVAPRVKDLGPEHMSSMKMTSFQEVDRRTDIVNRMQNTLKPILADLKVSTDPSDTPRQSEALRELGKLIPVGQISDDQLRAIEKGEVTPDLLKTLGRKAAENSFMTGVSESLQKNEERYAPSQKNFAIARDAILEAMGPPSGDPMTKEEFIDSFANITGTDLRADIKFEAIVERYPDISAAHVDLLANIMGGALEGTASRDMGVVSSFVKDLVPDLNQTVGQTGGREVFHHGDDAGNPFSVEKDNFPMTVILPKGATNGGEQIRVVKDSSEFLSLAKDLKRQGYAVPVNEMWNTLPGLVDVRRESFTEARNTVAQSLGATVQDLIRMERLSRPI